MTPTLLPPCHWVEPWPGGVADPGAPRAVGVVIDVAVRIEHARAAGVTLEAIASRSGLAASTIRAISRGERWPNLETVVRLQTVLSGGTDG